MSIVDLDPLYDSSQGRKSKNEDVAYYMPDPPSLSRHQIPTQSTAHKRSRGPLPEIGFHSDGTHGPLCIKRV